MSRRRGLLPWIVLLLLLLLIGGGVGVGFVVTAPEHAESSSVDLVDLGEASEGVDAEHAAAGGRERVRVRGGSESHPGSPGSSGTVEADGAGETDPEGGEQRDGASNAGGGSADGAVPGEDDRARVHGRVVDATTDAALADARILVVRRGHSWLGTRATADGSFEGSIPDETADGALVELRIAKPGYRTVVVPWAGGDVDVRLEPLDHVPQPGVVEGLATAPDGSRMTGRILLTTYDEMGDHHGIWALADEGGAFRLEGVAPGWWRMRIAGGGEWSEVVVPDGGTTRLHVVSGEEPWPGTMTKDEFLTRHRELREGRPPGITDEKTSDAQREAAAWQRALEMQDLEGRWRGIRPTRSLVVTGLPGAANAHLRAATTRGPNHSWRVRIADGTATFGTLTPETWSLVLEIPGAPPVAHELTIEEASADAAPDTGTDSVPASEPVSYEWPKPDPPDSE